MQAPGYIRRISAATALAALALLYVGDLPFTAWVKRSVHRESRHAFMVAYMKREATQHIRCLRFSLRECPARSGDHEMDWAGARYDIVKMEVTGDSCRVWAWMDDAETDFLKQMARRERDFPGDQPQRRTEEKWLTGDMPPAMHGAAPADATPPHGGILTAESPRIGFPGDMARPPEWFA